MKHVPVADGLFTWPADAPQLIGSKCGECGIVTFPRQDSCPRCASTAMAEHLLPRRGRLWAWTTQGFRASDLRRQASDVGHQASDFTFRIH